MKAMYFQIVVPAEILFEFVCFFAPAVLPRCQSIALDKDPKQSQKR